MTTSDATLCPRCRQPNQCAVAYDLPPQQCWCMQQAPIAELACPVPEGTYCLCQQCLQPYTNEHG